MTDGTHWSDPPEDKLQRYSDFRPSQFDTQGLGLDERQDWLVAPVSQTRDSGCLDRANFQATLASLDGESEHVEVHRFGHWGPGWFEIILVAPGAWDQLQELAEIKDALEGYPVVDESLLSELEHEERWECWENYAREDFRRELHNECAIGENADAIEARIDALTDAQLETLYSENYGDEEHTDEGPQWDFRRAVDAFEASLCE